MLASKLKYFLTLRIVSLAPKELNINCIIHIYCNIYIIHGSLLKILLQLLVILIIVYHIIRLSSVVIYINIHIIL